MLGFSKPSRKSSDKNLSSGLPDGKRDSSTSLKSLPSASCLHTPSLSNKRKSQSVDNGIYSCMSTLSDLELTMSNNDPVRIFSPSYVEQISASTQPSALDPVLKNTNATSSHDINKTKNDSILQTKAHGTTDKISMFDHFLDRGILVDVLPSFELDTSLHKKITRNSSNLDDFGCPPSYSELNTTSAATLDNQSTLVNRETNSDLSTLHNSYQVPQSQAQQNDLIIENINLLPNKKSPLVLVQITLINDVVKPNEPVEQESLLKEYTTGDIVNGYVTVTNLSGKPVKFEMFYVSLEGYMSVFDPKTKKITTKRFLRQIDASASWSNTRIELSSGLLYKCGGRDEFDNTILGLANSRILQPKTKYKKHFMFKFPKQLLETNCKHNHFSHCQMPPSFGIDRFCNDREHANIQVNPILRYGHNYQKGSPILTTDFSSNNFSVNYSVEAKLVGLETEGNKQFNNEQSNLHVIKDAKYNIRFAPFSNPLLEFTPPNDLATCPQRQVLELEKEVIEKLNVLEKFITKVEKRKNGEDVQFCLGDLNGANNNKDGDIVIVDQKLKHLYKNNKKTCKERFSNGHLESNKLILDENSVAEKTDQQNTALATLKYPYTVKSKLKSLLAQSSSDNSQSGLMRFNFKITSEKALPYTKPKLLQKRNTLENKNKHDAQNFKFLQSHLKAGSLLKSLELNLESHQANNTTEGVLPPEIEYIKPSLLLLTTSSMAPLPLHLTATFLKSEVQNKKVKDSFKLYHNKLQSLKESFEENSEMIKEICSNELLVERPVTFQKFISKGLAMDVLSLATLSVKQDTAQNYFAKSKINFNKDNELTFSKVLGGLGSKAGGDNNNNQGSAGKWRAVKPGVYQRKVEVDLELNDEFRDTLVPSFQSCLTSRVYIVRLEIKLKDQVGCFEVDVPVDVRFFE
ncbi:hypothetical protein ACO0QE_003037 [Hanseniaspora vineae]